ncbi:MAG: sigma-70 family RNA polymerase sigma factor [Phycisphaerales bacterium]|nr:sigma-70 family RNA polymerase sigma factor [Phycisphaerales bacterium]
MYEQTTTSLLDGLADPANDGVWREFDERYRGTLISLARTLGLGDADAQDAAQETLTRFYKAYRAGRYDRGRGRLRAWITAIARNCIRDIHNARAGRREHRGLSAIEHRLADREFESAWDAASRCAVLRRSLQRLRAETDTGEAAIRAFEEVVLRGRKPGEVAQSMGISRNDVYLAKHRCLSRLRSLADTMTRAYETDGLGAA